MLFLVQSKKGCFDNASAWLAYYNNNGVSYGTSNAEWALIALGITMLSIFLIYVMYLVINHYLWKRKQRKIEEEEENYKQHNIGHLPLNIYLNMPK